jgi:hypothetical protein
LTTVLQLPSVGWNFSVAATDDEPGAGSDVLCDVSFLLSNDLWPESQDAILLESRDRLSASKGHRRRDRRIAITRQTMQTG